MSDTAPRNPVGASQMLADALLRSVSGTSAQLRVTATSAASNMAELGLTPTCFADVVVSPVVMRKLRPSWQQGNESRWELLVSATSVSEQVNTLQLDSAQSLFSMTLAVTVAGQEYLVDAIAVNEAFGQAYLYRLSLREARRQAI